MESSGRIDSGSASGLLQGNLGSSCFGCRGGGAEEPRAAGVCTCAWQGTLGLGQALCASTHFFLLACLVLEVLGALGAPEQVSPESLLPFLLPGLQPAPAQATDQRPTCDSLVRVLDLSGQRETGS